MDRAARHRLGRLAAYLLVVGAFAAGIGAAHRRVDADQTDDLVRSCVRGNALRAAHNRLAAADGRPGLRVPIVDCPAAVRGEQPSWAVLACLSRRPGAFMPVHFYRPREGRRRPL